MMIAITRKDGDYGLFTILLSIFSLFHFFHSIHCYRFLSNITQSQPLSQGNTLVSLTQIFELGFFTPNESPYQYVGVWYKGIYPKTLVWVANRESPLNITDSQAIFTIGSHGNLQILNRNNDTVWSTKVNANPDNSAAAILLDSGNLVVEDTKSGGQIWQSFDNPADVLMPSSKIGFNIKTGDEYKLSSWKAENDPFPGDFTVKISKKKPPEVSVTVNGTTIVWRSGPWDKAKYTGVPDMDTFYESQYDVEEDSEKGTTFMRFKSYQSSSVRHFILSTKGVIKLMEKNEEEGRFYTNWEIPESLCDFYGACGPFGVCRNFTSPNCECLRGFAPKSSREWKTGAWRDGCVRRKELICHKNKTSIYSKDGQRDGFWRIGNVKPPDFYEFVELSFSSEYNCRKTCQGNCSCLAYSYVQGIGCLVWSKVLIDLQGFTFGGVDLFVRLNHEELVGLGRKTIMTSAVVLFACGIIGAAAFVLRKRRAIRTENESDARDLTETTKLFELAEPSDSARHNLKLLKQHSAAELPMFEFGAILVATDHFSEANKLGQGGFGSVYKGTMPEGKLVAVKRLSSSSGQGVIEFKNEMLLISRLQHRNLVKLFGYCIEKEEKLLVYEYMSNNSLDKFLFNSSRSAELNWTTRMNIILGVSRGLGYLHHDSCLRIIHRDLKVSNILLDEKMNPKISDFGLARMFEGTMDLTRTRRIVGTLGYMSPEYAIAGLFSEKSDVFSFGVILLEILSGQKNTSFYDYENYLTLIAYAWKMWSEDKGPKMVDEALEGLYSPAEAMRCLNVALLCVQDSATDRPTMTDIVFMLSNETDRPEPKKPLFSFQISSGGDFQRANDVNSSSNEATTSLIEGR